MAAKWPTSVATDADLYVAVNALATTLAGTITDSQPTISLASTTGFPTAGAVLIDQEIIFYTGISGNDLTSCTRGADGTTQAAHTAGVPVSHVVVAYHHNALKDEIEALETSLNLTASRALASSVSGRIEVSAVLASELAYLSGVTSAIQDQLNGKQPAGTYVANPLTADLAAGGYKITGLAAGSTTGDALRYEQVIGQFLLLTGGTLSGILQCSAGAVGTPGLAIGEANKGLYHIGADELGICTNGTLSIDIKPDGSVLKPLQPCFIADVNTADSDVTGDGTTYQLVFDEEILDANADYNATTGIFTAPQDGKYSFSVGVRLSGITSSHTACSIVLVTSNRGYSMSQFNPYAASVSAAVRVSTAYVADMDAGDTAYVNVTVSNGTKVIDFGTDAGNPRCLFAGFLIG